MVYRYCWHNYMVWGGNIYVEIFVGGGANPKKVPQMEKKTADRPPHIVKNVPNIEKNAAKSHPH